MPPEESAQTDTPNSPQAAAATTDAPATQETAAPSIMGDAVDGDVPAPAADADKPAEEAAPVAEIPEAYELAAPEGLEITPEIAEEITPVFKEVGLTNDAANKLMPLAGKFKERILAAQADAFEATKADWAKEAKADPEIGGAKLGETQHFVAKALDQFGAPKGSDFRTLLDETGLGNHPEMIRMFRKIGERISEEQVFARADSGAAVKPSREQILYGQKESGA